MASSSNPEIKSAFIVGYCFNNRLANSRPPISGIMRSLTAT